MQELIKVSVCITFYNQKEYVDECLDSVLKQNVDFKYEILIGDDGSNDGTYELLLEWAKRVPQIRLFRMDRREDIKYYSSERASRNRINLIKRVRGKYFLFLDGDDYYCDNNKLQKQVCYMDKREYADCAICGHNVEANSRVAINDVDYIAKYTAKQYWKKLYFHPDSLMFRSEYIKKIPWEVALDNFNDNFITFCFLRYGNMLYLPDKMIAYRQTGNGIWTGESNSISFLRDLIDFDLEIKLDKSFYRYSCSRHFADFKYFWNRA